MTKIERYPRPPMPKTRKECKDGIRPCPFVSCRYHLSLDVFNKRIKVYNDDITTMEYTCALDLAEEGGMNLESIGSLMNVTRERIRQIVDMALRNLRFKRLKK